MSGLAPGEVVLERATRSFALTHERSRTLKELFIRRRRSARRSRIDALHEVTLGIAPGEAVGLVGRNGAGKTSTLRCLAGIVPLDSGRAQCGGRTVALLELGAGFGPEFSGRENIYLNGALHGFSREEIERHVDDIVAFSELGDFIDVPVKAYSSGMFLRLGFSIAAFLEADVMLIDEILAVGDEAFQRKCLDRIGERMDAGATLVLVSHDFGAIERVCRRVVVLDRGRVQFDGQVAEGLLFYHGLLGTERDDSRSVRPSVAAQVEIAELELRDADDRRRGTFHPGEPMQVRMSVASPGGVERMTMTLEVRTHDGQVCFRTSAPVGPLAGESEVRFDVARLALLGGDYDVAVGASPEDAPAGRLDRVRRFSVADTADGEGVSDLRGSWTVGGRPVAEQQEAVR